MKLNAVDHMMLLQIKKHKPKATATQRIDLMKKLGGYRVAVFHCRDEVLSGSVAKHNLKAIA